ncbi:hypothetical protein RUM44_010903 [Polyplax serrata]|uniref:Uncharacterized protein n=1 Tax=Polyplax serrata TaxID=468196 RepID=A0ABR1ANH3_POLSC
MAILAKILLLCVLLTHLKAETYTRKWDNINVDDILASNRLLENYKKCLLDQGPCTEEGKELKKNIPDALQTECRKCTQTQKVNTEKVIDFMIENRKPWWEELQKKYDPTGIYYRRKMEKRAREHHVDGEDVEEDEKNVKETKSLNKTEKYNDSDELSK